ncbi:MAG: SpoIIE family protein phosphatase [Magnetococcales bacterium]|nr:SpoIIE family protein phosphatase [Magnetococcales bacterium]
MNTASNPANPVRQVVLIVDDTPENIDILKGALVDAYTVRPAPNGQIALKAAAVVPHPDIILLDVMMPGMDGYEVCRRLKGNDATKEIPVIFVTAKSEVNDELEGLRLGAVDYITKPFSVPIVQARIKTHLALRAANLKLDKQNQILLLERELITNIVLKMRNADVLDERNIRYLISPVESTAGDILLSTFTPDDRQLVLLGDFTGHGLPAAIGGPLVTFILHEWAARSASAQEIMETINAQLCVRLPTGLFFACILMEFDAKRETVQIWNAALPECLLIRAKRIETRIASSLPPLGIIQELDFNGNSVQLITRNGDIICAYSDGIIEEKSINGEMFGAERLESFLLKVASGQHNFFDLMAVLHHHSGKMTYEDDITLVEITV